MPKLKTKKEVNSLSLLFSVTYLVSYITRINYGAVISEMVAATGIAKSLLSLAVTGGFITYGAGQIISGICGDRFSPKKLVSKGLFATILMNCLIPLCKSPYQMLFVWCLNGFAQAFMWPPLVMLMTALLSEDDYKKTAVRVSWGGSLGTIIVYLSAPVIIYLSSWKVVFFISALFGVIMLFVWNRYSYEIDVRTKKRSVQTDKKGFVKFLFTPLMILLMLAIILQGMLRDGVTTWTPSYISETYNMSSIISILSGVLLPVFAIISFFLTSLLYRKKIKNPLLCAGVIFAAGTLSALVLYMFTETNAAFSVFFSALLTGCMHGVNLMLVCMVPPYFNKYGSVSTVSGIINSCTYVGSAISTYGIAVIAENRGWKTTLLLWFLIALAGTVICFGCAAPWKKKFNSAEQNCSVQAKS